MGKYFEVRRELRQVCVMSPWFFNIFFDRLVRLLMRKQWKWKDGNVEWWEVKQVLYAECTVLVAETKEHLQHTVNNFERTSGRIGRKINVEE